MGETFNTEPEDRLANHVPYVLDLKGAPISYKALMETFSESCFGMIQPTNIKAEPKTMESVLRWMLPYVCDPNYTGYRVLGHVQHDRQPGWGTEIRTIAFVFQSAGFGVDASMERGTILFEVYGRPNLNSKITNIGIESG